MASSRLILWVFLVTQCIVLTFCEEDSEFTISDESESCDGSCKAPGRAETEAKAAKESQSRPKKSKEQRQQEMQQDVMQYQNYLQYMEEEGGEEEPLSIQDFLEYMQFMRNGHESGLSPEEVQQKWAKQQHDKAMQSPEVQEALKENLPDFSETFDDLAYRGIAEIPADSMPPKALGCGVVEVPSGKFFMGSENDENYQEDGESPYRKVKISKAFWMDVCEVTNGQFLQFWNETKMKGNSNGI